MSAPEQYLTGRDLAARWRMSPGSIANMRLEGRGPAYVKIGTRVRYRLCDVLAYERHVQGSGVTAA